MPSMPRMNPDTAEPNAAVTGIAIMNIALARAR